ncbi:MAG TPA: PqqD family protein [Polyangia bacterium]|jgi:hypothetical protein
MTAPSYVRNPELLADDLGHGILILDTDRAKVIELNRTGARLWRRLAAPATAAELLEVLAAAYPAAERAALAGDVERFLRAATACDAVREVGAK